MNSAQSPAGVQSELAPIFEDLSQSKKLSEIKPPLPLLPNNFMTSNINLLPYFPYIWTSLVLDMKVQETNILHKLLVYPLLNAQVYAVIKEYHETQYLPLITSLDFFFKVYSCPICADLEKKRGQKCSTGQRFISIEVHLIKCIS